jgi:nickel/cobalt exporter
MTDDLKALLTAAASIGFLHTLFGPDHYLPFIAMSWARKWSSAKTAVITALCAVGHIGGSVVLGLIGVSLGLAVKQLEGAESIRGDLAAWLLIAFGLAYLAWGIRLAYRSRPHQHAHPHALDAADSHEHSHADSPMRPHLHPHVHLGDHVHVHDIGTDKTITPWVLFVIFVFGPCEPLIPLLMYPAARESVAGLLFVTGVFGAITMATMLTTVFLGRAGVDFLPIRKLQRYSHAMAGATILLCGLAIEFLGL